MDTRRERFGNSTYDTCACTFRSAVIKQLRCATRGEIIPPWNWRIAKLSGERERERDGVILFERVLISYFNIGLSSSLIGVYFNVLVIWIVSVIFWRRNIWKLWRFIIKEIKYRRFLSKIIDLVLFFLLLLNEYDCILYQLVTTRFASRSFVTTFRNFIRKLPIRMYSALLPMKTFRNFITGERSIFKASTAPSKFYYNLPNTGGALLWMQLTNLENFWYLHRRKNYSNEWIFLEENSFFPLNDYPEFSFFSLPLKIS